MPQTAVWSREPQLNKAHWSPDISHFDHNVYNVWHHVHTVVGPTAWTWWGVAVFKSVHHILWIATCIPTSCSWKNMCFISIYKDAWNDQERSICFPRFSALLFHQHLNSNFKDSKTWSFQTLSGHFASPNPHPLHLQLWSFISYNLKLINGQNW